MSDSRADVSVTLNTSAGRSRKRAPRWIVGTLIGVLLVGAGSTAVVVRQIIDVESDLRSAVSLTTDLKNDMILGKTDDALDTLATVQSHVSSAHQTTSGPIWRGASALPFVGRNLSAVTEITISADEVMNEALPPLIEGLKAADPASLSPIDGKINLSPLEQILPDITRAAQIVKLSGTRMANIDDKRLLPAVSEPFRAARDELIEVGEQLEGLVSFVKLVPAVLGSEGPRNNLILVQNNAEVRATGGIPGALAVLRTDDGQIELDKQASAGDLGRFSPALPVDDDQESLFSSRVSSYMQSVNLTPDFPTAASTAKLMWEERNPGQIIDVVLALDPVVLSHLLDATGPIDLSDPLVMDLVAGTNLPISLTSGNVVPTLLSDVYREIEDPSLQDLYFAAVASDIFRSFTSGQGNPSRLLDALKTSVDERRLYLWSARGPEQQIISQTALAGAVTGSRVGGAAFGMYFNDGTGAKMDYYAGRTVQLIQGCRADGYGEYTLRVSAINNAPADAHLSLPPYVTGRGVFGVEPGNIRTNYVAYGPTQSLMQAANVNGKPVPFASGFHGQRPVGTVSVELSPGETAELEFTFVKVVQDGEPKLSVTPTVDPLSDVVLPTTKQPGCE